MTTTINISLPKTMYQDAKKMLSARGYTSISELVRDALRGVIYPRLTENGFTPEFEEEVLRRAGEPIKNDIVWNGKGSFIDFVLKEGKKRYGESQSS